MRTELERFEDKFIPEPNSGCWLWLGSVHGRPNHKYGYMKYKGRYQVATRISLDLYRGGIAANLQANHKCHNTYCVNPDHIYSGTQTDNMEDRRKAGRHVKFVGSKHPRSKLDEAKVVDIKKALANGQSAYSLGKLYGVAKIQILRIKNGDTWSHVS